jgi:MoaA/NifB/PqqE/SkfB family radical SAM enzyme
MDGYVSSKNFKDKDYLSYNKISEIIKDCSKMGVKAMQVTGGGESTTHPKIKEIFTDILSKGMDLGLVTNGSRLNDETCNILKDSHWVRVSIDAGTAETYSSLRGKHQREFNKVMSNIENLASKGGRTIIGVGFVVQKENYKEVFNAAKLAKASGADNFRISALFTPIGYKYFESFMDEAIVLCRECESLNDENFTVFNLFNDRIKDCFVGEQNYSFCPIKEIQAYIGADYNVYTCCTLAYNERGLVGSIKDKSFADLWGSSKKISMFMTHNPSYHCKLPCLYKSKNQFINYCIESSPDHVNFI